MQGRQCGWRAAAGGAVRLVGRWVGGWVMGSGINKAVDELNRSLAIQRVIKKGTKWRG